ncbi:radical SAM protein [bacterium]|nr:radical SAM protein [bacterium]
MHYEGNIIRPPSEANSILLQVTVGCSHNKCTFCAAYKGERFKIKSDETILADIDFASRYCRQQRRLFLCDGDAMIISQKRLPGIFRAIQEKLPWVSRVGLYANAKSLKRKSLEELKALKELGLGIVYMGLESGDDETLARVHKKGNAEEMIEQGRKVKEAGIKLSITVLLGLAGPDRSNIHALETGRVLSAINPEYVGALSLMLVPNTPLYDDWIAGDFILIEPEQMLQELGLMIAHTHLTRGLFFANHASNYLPIKARLPRDKEATLQLISSAMAGKVPLKPEAFRGL